MRLNISLTARSSVQVNYNDIYRGYTGTDNNDVAPLFSPSGNYHLSCASPCLNSGNPAVMVPYDLAGNPRPMPVGTNPDLGCYEFDQYLSVAVTSSGLTTFCTGDSVKLTAVGTYGGIIFHWQFNGVNIPGDSTPFLYASRPGFYTASETDSSCTVSSRPVRITVLTNTAHITHAGYTVICNGDSLLLYTTGGEPGVTYNSMSLT